MTAALEILGIIVVAVMVIWFVLYVAISVHEDFIRPHATRSITEAEARENCRPYLDPITPAYYGVHSHNGTVRDAASEDTAA